MSPAAAKEKWLARLAASVQNGSFVRLALGSYCGPDQSLQKLLVRPVTLRGGPHLSFVYRYHRRDVTKNVAPVEGLALVAALLGSDFQTGHLSTTELTLQLDLSAGAGARLTESKSAHPSPPAAAHDQTKNRIFTPNRSPWLQALGVTTAEGRVAKGMEAKFRQINRFVEVLSHLFADAGLQPPKVAQASRLSHSPGEGRPAFEAAPALTLVDMGCGKGYLTFAAYDWLERAGWTTAVVRGLDARPELVQLCNRVAQASGFARLCFEAGTIAQATLAELDVLIALHACDTATDDAIAKGVRAGASLILVAPCCHQELRPQLRPPPALAGALRHGILRERQAEFITDALRAGLLEWAGYATKVFEFVSTEHTSKNLMIAARKQTASGRRAAAEQVKELAALYRVRSQRLATQLGFDLA